MDRLVELLSACSANVASSTSRCGVRGGGEADDEDAAATVPINRANNVDSNNNSSTFCGSLRDAFLDEQHHEKNNVITHATLEKGSQDDNDEIDNANDDDDMSNLWKDLILYEDYKPPIPRVIETTIPSPPPTVAISPPKHKKNLLRSNFKINSINNNTDNGKGSNSNSHMGPITNIYKDDSDQQQKHQQQHVEEDDSLMGLDLLSGEEVQKDSELPRSPTLLNKSTTTTTYESSPLHRQDVVWPGVKSSPAADTDGIGEGGGAAAAKPSFRYSSTHSWTYSLTTCDAGGLSSTGLGGGGGGGGVGDEMSPCSSSWSDDFVDINDHAVNAIEALFSGASSSSGRDVGGVGGGFRATFTAGGCAGEFDDNDDHDGSSYSSDKSSSLLLRNNGARSGAAAGSNAPTVPPPSTILTTKTISPKATTRATTTTTTSPFLFHGHHHQSQQQLQQQQQPLRLASSSPSPSSPPPQQQQPQQHVKMNSYNSGRTLTTTTSMSDSTTLNCSTLATHDDDEDVIHHYRLYHHLEHDETQEESLDIGDGEEVADFASI